MTWRNCNASLRLVEAINARWPNRDKTTDGTIGDAAHAARTSDHNPWIKVNGIGVVRARDIDKDGIDAEWLAEELRKLGAAGDKRLVGGGYVIYNRRITSPDFSRWNAYNGANPHTSHIHVSFTTNPAGFDSNDAWEFLGQSSVAPVAPAEPVVSEDIKWIQDRLNALGFGPLVVDGIRGPKTDAAIRSFQKARGLAVDGIVGAQTRGALNGAPPFPLPRDHYFGLITGPARSHGGYHAKDRPHIRLIQEALVRKGYVPGITDPNSRWVDEKFEKPTADAVARFQRAEMPGTKFYGQVWWDDWAKLLS